MLTKYYDITRPFFQLCVDNELNSIKVCSYQYMLFLNNYNVSTIFVPKYKYYDDREKVPATKEYYNYREKYSDKCNKKNLTLALQYASYVMISLIFKSSASLINLSEQQVKDLLGFTQKVEKELYDTFSNNFIMFINNMTNVLFNNRNTLNNIFLNNCSYKSANAPFPADVNPTPDDYFTTYKNPYDFAPLRTATGTVKDADGYPVIDPEDPTSYVDNSFTGWIYGYGAGFYITDKTRYELPDYSKSKITTWDKLETQINKTLDIFKNLTDEQKIISEMFNSNFEGAIATNGVISLFAFMFNARYKVCIKDEPSYLFAVASTLMDSELMGREFKRLTNSARPVTAIRYFLNKQQINSWYPYEGSIEMNGNQFLPYQGLTFITPAHSESLAGHAYSAGSMGVIFKKLYGNCYYNSKFTFKFYDMGWIYPALKDQTQFTFGEFNVVNKTSLIEPGLTPKTNITLKFKTVDDLVNNFCLARLYGGIHWESTLKLSKQAGICVTNKTYKKLVEEHIVN
jgi:hypothetical protein